MLKRLNLKSSGIYRCEISAEAPNFSSVEGEGRMEVVCKYLQLSNRHRLHFSHKQNTKYSGNFIEKESNEMRKHPTNGAFHFGSSQPNANSISPMECSNFSSFSVYGNEANVMTIDFSGSITYVT